MVFLTMYYMSWDLVISMRIRNLKSENVIRYMPYAQVDGTFVSIESEFSNYLLYRNFLFSHIS